MKVTRAFEPMGDRYRYDFKLCHFRDGWAQLDTKQDAWYYGNWINPLTLRLCSYAEGDVVVTECADAAEFVTAVREACEWQKQAGYFIGIDGMCSTPIIEAVTRMGLAEYLH